MSHDLTRLPKWAQELIEDQRRSISELTQQVENAELVINGGDVETEWTYSTGGLGEKPLPANIREVRWTSKERDLKLGFSLRSDGPHLWVHRGEGLAIAPVSSNVVRIQARGYRDEPAS